MALYQPTNVIPSSYTKGTVDAVNDKMEISWQVNGNSAMTAFQIDFYLNDANSTPVTSTGKKGTTPEEQKQLGLPFYGTDRFGRPQFFTWSPNGQTWEEWSKYQLTNGNEYKYKITQWYDTAQQDTIYIDMPESFGFDSGVVGVAGNANVTKGILEFQVTSDYLRQRVYYNFVTNKGWYFKNNIYFEIDITYYPNGTGGGLNYLGLGTFTVSTENALIPSNFSIFFTQEQPKLTIYKTNSKFDTNGAEYEKLISNGALNASVGYFHADYEQAQKISICWIRWQVATATYNFDTKKWTLGDILQDTGDIYTPTLNYEFNGFFNSYDKDGNYTGNGYAIRAIGESESGQECDSSWIFFNINIENQGQYGGDFTVQCLNKENATLLEWEGVEVIPPTTSPQGYEPTISNGSVTLLPKSGDTEYSVTWDKKIVVENGENKTIPMNFTAPWTAVWKGKLTTEYSTHSQQIVFNGVSSEYNTESEILEVTVTTGDVKENSLYYGRTILNYDDAKTEIPIASIEFISIKNNGGAFGSSFEYDDSTRQYTIIASSPMPNTSFTLKYLIAYKYFCSVISQTIPGQITSYSVVSQSNEVKKYNIEYNDDTITATLYCLIYTPVSLTADVDFRQVVHSPQGVIFSINWSEFGISISCSENQLSLLYNQHHETSVLIPDGFIACSIIISKSYFSVGFYDQRGYCEFFEKQISAGITGHAISSVSIYGGDKGATVESVSVYKGDRTNIFPLYKNPEFEPVWNDPNYNLYMTANFNRNLEGGTGTTTGSGFRVYRQEIGKNVLTPIATVPSTTTSIKDYGIVSRKAYKYSLYAYDNNGAFMSAVENEKVVATCFKNYSLLVCDYDEANDEYHVRKQYLFALNLSVGSVGNNNSPILNENFTRYPTRMPSTQNYASGTLQGLIGAIYTVPALIEQIGNYKWTAKPSTMDYFDNVDLEKELYDLSTAPYQLFLRDMKGRLRMIATNGAITMTTNIKQKQQSISISFPWVEIGDTSDVTIIQTPDDYGWNNDNQILDVSLDVNVATGELSATYPYPYNGTKFYLTGVNKETLTAKTPLGITPAQFKLSETATQPDDGELTTTVKVNSEGNQ